MSWGQAFSDLNTARSAHIASQCLGSSPSSAVNYSFLLMCTLGGACDSSSTWVLATYMGDPDWCRHLENELVDGRSLSVRLSHLNK